MRIFEPQQLGRRFFHYIPTSEDFLETRARCLACRKPKRFSEFGAALIGRGRPALLAVCFQCRGVEAEFSSADHPLYTPELGLYFDRLHISAKAGAQVRGLEFIVSKDDFLNRYLRAGGKCELTGMLLRPYDKGKVSGVKARYAPSIDRINSSRGYFPDNIQIVAAIVNVMKTDLSLDDFVAICRMVTDHSLRSIEATVSGDCGD